MEKTFVELKLFQVKADKIDQFETMIKQESKVQQGLCYTINF